MPLSRVLEPEVMESDEDASIRIKAAKFLRRLEGA